MNKRKTLIIILAVALVLNMFWNSIRFAKTSPIMFWAGISGTLILILLFFGVRALVRKIREKNIPEKTIGRAIKLGYAGICLLVIGVMVWKDPTLFDAELCWSLLFAFVCFSIALLLYWKERQKKERQEKSLKESNPYLEQLDRQLQAGLIDKAEYKIMKERYARWNSPKNER
ncbi:MAG: APC family permease [Oscillospiraceae bacterium]|nr:APC family permease [Oscillospiraceae bacterium]